MYFKARCARVVPGAPSPPVVPLLFQVFRCWVVQGLPKGDLVLKDKCCSLNNRLSEEVKNSVDDVPHSD